jgi:epoxyqueuosine reductase
MTLTESLKAESLRLGFDLAGICPAVSPAGLSRFHAWLAAGYAGEMHYLARRADAYSHPRHVMDGARSMVLLAMNYRTAAPTEPRLGQGRVSRYAWGLDYHSVIHDRLRRLAEFLQQQSPGCSVRGVVDTAPLLEREFAALAGLGWIGKNTLLLNKQIGSWFFLAALLTDLEFDPDDPHAADHCGTCRACLDACPTGALVEPYILDSRRCISYLTIELRDAIPASLRPGVGDWLFGCDICQEVCPWNHHTWVARSERRDGRGLASSGREPPREFIPGINMNPIDLASLFSLDDDAFRKRFRHTPLWRPKRRGILRNAAIVLGNFPHDESLPALARGLHDPEPLIRGASAWALGRHRGLEAKNHLLARRAIEADHAIRAEIEAAL